MPTIWWKSSTRHITYQRIQHNKELNYYFEFCIVWGCTWKGSSSIISPTDLNQNILGPYIVDKMEQAPSMEIKSSKVSTPIYVL